MGEEQAREDGGEGVGVARDGCVGSLCTFRSSHLITYHPADKSWSHSALNVKLNGFLSIFEQIERHCAAVHAKKGLREK